MIITNNSGLPSAVLNLLQNSAYEPKGDISVTRLIKPPRIVALYKRYGSTIEIDAQEMSWSVLGQSVHVLLERSAGKDVIVERRLHTKIYGWDVNGQADVYYPKEELVDDYKVTSVWAYLNTIKEEWIAQLNLNAMLHRLLDQPVEQLRIIAFLRDWQMQKAKRDLKYPQHPIHPVGIPMWDNDKCVDYAEERTRMHQDAQALPDEELPLCTPEERWYRTGGFPAMQNGLKKADKVLKSAEEWRRWTAAEAPRLKPGRYFLPMEERPGVNMRCQSYCEARSVCPFALSLKPVDGGEEE